VQALQAKDPQAGLELLNVAVKDVTVAQRLRDLNVAGQLMEMINRAMKKGGRENTLSLALGPYTAMLQYGLIDPDSVRPA